MKVYIVRHTSVDVPYDIFYGQTDVPVRENSFVEEATRVKEKIAPLSFDAVFTSPLTRCVRLATFCGYGDAMRDERLKELNFGNITEDFLDSILGLVKTLDTEEQKNILNTILERIEYMSFKSGNYDKVKEMINEAKEKINEL